MAYTTQSNNALRIRAEYHLRFGVLVLATVLTLLGAAMVFRGLQGSFDWAVQSPHTISAKLTNASPGIGFATMGMLLALVIGTRKIG
ncbi:MAG TPA: hypothetical protein VN749_03665 [Candidatus Eisenbacteria bacterium]|nr:hypothetical protein [Candidatus Eisenbacteria bacterium]